ncbi:putative fibropellin-1 isoform X2 [Apostichopus japonicus]|uniref:Putative fibropellin-1 isoform X2 n=1 Tax=Stichopus japonicus TaxID=307972 RepID=A0A2G8LMF9_STIJA|nr:putative fibropellin-1 isoform X2 [Apostichopus japonicus]
MLVCLQCTSTSSNVGPTDCGELPCLNGGTCFQGANERIWCQCSDRYTGTLCQRLDVSACDSTPCQNGGLCSLHDGGYSCSCAPGYAGATCSLFITTRCASLPCENGGTCFVSSFDVQQYYCACPTGFYGDHCHLSVTDCSCENDGKCQNINLEGGGIGLICVCPLGYSGSRCEIAPLTACDEQPCGHGNCFLHAMNESAYFCNCFDGYTGDDCTVEVTPGSCSNSPCQNSGECSSVVAGSGTEYTHCDCPPGYIGIFCQISTEGCSPNPCLNGGLCLASSPTTVTCQCSIGFVGPRCQYKGACSSFPCQNNATCYNAYQPQRDLPDFACECRGVYRGLICNETADPCSSNPCLNGGICLKNVNGDVFVCICPVGYTGDICEKRQGALCSANPAACTGPGEMCVEQENYFHCECEPNWRRSDEDATCHPPCSMNPCQNNGECYLNADRDVYCNCPEGFTGSICETPAGPCDSCKNGGLCMMFSTAFYCDCVNGYSGIDCSVPPTDDPITPQVPAHPCDSHVCQNGGTCLPIDMAFGYYCVCPAGFTGLDCSNDTRTTETPRTSTEAPRTSTETLRTSTVTTKQTTAPLPPPDGDVCLTNKPCQNNAFCIPAIDKDGSYYPMCLCEPGYAGATCSVLLPTPNVCLSRPCGPDATCYSNATSITGYSCRCLRADRFCAGSIIAQTTPTPSVPPCESNPCMNNGTCASVGNIFTCTCPPYIIGDLCESDIRECTHRDVRYSEGDIRYDGCIMCNCSNGDWQCSEETCYCEHEEKLYENGQTWTDRCMTCFCYNGGWLCSDADCRNTCLYEGERYFSGDVREESCQTCFCNSGDWTCTEKDCDFCVDDGDAFFLEGSVRRDECNVCTCTEKEWRCTVKDCDWFLFLSFIHLLPQTSTVICQFHLDYPFSLISDRQDQLIRVITAHLEARYDLQQNQLLEISLSEGSIVVNITLYESIGTDQDIQYVASQIEHKVMSGSLHIAFDGFLIPAKSESFSETVVKMPNDDGEVSSIVIVFLCFGIISFLILVVIIMGLRLYCRKAKPQTRGSSQRRRLFRSRGSESSEDIPPTAVWDKYEQVRPRKRQKKALWSLTSLIRHDLSRRLRQKGLDGI